MDTTITTTTSVTKSNPVALAGFAERSSRRETPLNIVDIDKIISGYSLMHGLIERVKKRVSLALDAIEEYRFTDPRNSSFSMEQAFTKEDNRVLQDLQTSLVLIRDAYVSMHARLKGLKLAYLLSSEGVKSCSLSARVLPQCMELLEAVDPLVYPNRTDARGNPANESEEKRCLRKIMSLVRKEISFEEIVSVDSDYAYERYVFENSSKKLACQPLHDIFPSLKETMDDLHCNADDATSKDVVRASLFMRLSLCGTDHDVVFQRSRSSEGEETRRNERVKYHIRTTQSDSISETANNTINDEIPTCGCDCVLETLSKLVAYAFALAYRENAETGRYGGVESSPDLSLE